MHCITCCLCSYYFCFCSLPLDCLLSEWVLERWVEGFVAFGDGEATSTLAAGCAGLSAIKQTRNRSTACRVNWYIWFTKIKTIMLVPFNHYAWNKGWASDGWLFSNYRRSWRAWHGCRRTIIQRVRHAQRQGGHWECVKWVWEKRTTIRTYATVLAICRN